MNYADPEARRRVSYNMSSCVRHRTAQIKAVVHKIFLTGHVDVSTVALANDVVCLTVGQAFRLFVVD